jgi:methylated-DNA-[protein]-cysteine S-methyltransferase
MTVRTSPALPDLPADDALLVRLRALEDRPTAAGVELVLDELGLGDVYGVVDGPIGRTWVAHNDVGVAFTFVTEDEGEFTARHRDRLPRRLRRAPVPDEIAAAIAASDGSRLAVDLRHTAPFQRDVLEATRLVPVGETRSYGWVARQIDRPAAVRAVGTALARNPIPIVIPCHRIVRGDGDVGSYLFGAERKRRLLQLEAA